MIPIRLMVVDLFSGDQVTDFAAAKASGIVGIIHKASEGISYADPAYLGRQEKAKNAGLLWGAYHFGRNTDVEQQAAHFLACANADANTLLCLDFEDGGNTSMSLAQARRFMSIVDQKSGRSCVLYSGNLIKEALGSTVDPFFAAHRLWLAEYGPVPRTQISWPKPWLWQFSGDGIGPGPKKVPGIPGAGGKLDLNSFDGTPEQLAAEWSGRSQVSKPIPAPPDIPGLPPAKPPIDAPMPPVVVPTPVSKTSGPVAAVGAIALVVALISGFLGWVVHQFGVALHALFHLF